MVKKTLSIVIIIVGFLLSACTQAVENRFLPEIVFKAEAVTFQSDYGYLYAAQATNNGKLWTLWQDNNDYSIRTFDRFALDLENIAASAGSGTLVTELYCEYPISGFVVNDNAITVVYLMESKIVISKVSIDGTELFETALDFRDETEIDIISTVIDSSGRLYIAWQVWGQTIKSGISALSNSGEALFTISGRFIINGLTLTDGDIPYAIVDNSSLREINPVSKTWGKSIDLQESFQSIYTGTNGIFYLDTATELYRYDQQEDVLTQLFNYSEIGISGLLLWLVQLDDNVFLASTTNGVFIIRPEEQTVSEVDSHIAAEPDTPDTHNRLTLALSLPTDPAVTDAITEFNSNNEDCRIEIREITFEELPRLQTELAVGRMPDIILYSDAWGVLRNEIPAQRLAAKGLLADLYEFIDSDPDLDRQSFLPNILEAASGGGSLYELPYRFWLDVAVGDAKRLGTEMGWTFDDLLQVLETTEFEGYILDPNTDRDSLLRTMLSFLIDDFIDWNNGNVFFDTYEFQRLLEVAKKYAPPAMSEEAFYEDELIAQGKQLMMWQTMSRPNYLQFFDLHFEEMVPIGLPVSDGVGHCIRYDSSFAISAVTEYPDIAWSFIRQFYMPEFFERDRQLIPIHADAIETWLTMEDSGFVMGIGDKEYKVGPATAYDIERTRQILGSVTRVMREDREVFDIISEETVAYFQSLRSVEETAEVIQSRVQILVWEQGG